jgi:two-component system, OmpR family, sensor kinase
MRKRIKTDLLIHDLKVPLAVVETGIISLLQRREKYGPITEKQEKVLARALRNTKVIQSLVNDILELGKSRKRIVSLKSLKFSDLIEQTLVETFDLVDRNTSEKINICADLPQLRDTLEERGLMLFMEEALWCQEVCLDEVKIRQILRNLLINALKYRKSRVELEVDKKDFYLVFSVKDDGDGIPSIYHKKIFESYFQMDVTDSSTVRGHGLGLAGVMILVEDMGGELFLESDEGKGAKFLVKLPL